MPTTASAYGIGGPVALSVPEAIAKAREALQQEGFGVLCDIDVQATLKNKINVDRPAYTILGACNPQLANQALSAEPDLGLLLPCNVVVFEEEGQVYVKAVDPEKLLAVSGNPALQPIAQDVKARLTRAMAQLG